METVPALLVAAVVNLRPIRPCDVPANHGHQAHAAFLNLVHAVDTSLSEQLHRSQARKPFTVSPLGGLSSTPSRGQLHVRPEDELWLRFTLLEPELFHALGKRFLAASASPEIQLGENRFLVISLVSSPGSDPWAGYTSFTSLLHGDSSQPVSTIKLQFASPTTFSFGRRKVPLPLPEQVFGGLLKKWNAFSPITLPVDLLELFTQQLAVSEINNLNTRMLDFGRYKEKGFTGTVAFQALGRWTADQLRSLNALADFAFYAGVGYKTTMGMGMTRRVSVSNGNEASHGPR